MTCRSKTLRNNDLIQVADTVSSAVNVSVPSFTPFLGRNPKRRLRSVQVLMHSA